MDFYRGGASMKRYIKIIAVSTFIVMFFIGCGKTKNNNIEEQRVDTESEQLIEISSIGKSQEDSQPYWESNVHDFAKAEGGYYYLETLPLRLMFFDEETKEYYPVCAKADCDHNNADCNAFLDGSSWYEKDGNTNPQYCMGSIYYYKGFIYLLNTNGYLTKVSPDGSSRKDVVKIYTYDGSTDTKLAFYDDNVYVYNSVGNLGGEQETTETITKYSLDGKIQNTVVSYTGTGAAIRYVKIYGERMYFLIGGMNKETDDTGKKIVFNYDSLYAYDLKSGEMGKVINEQVTDYCIDEQNNTIYYYVLGEGLYKMNVVNKENVKLFEASEESGSMDLSFDGKYIYMYNGIWVRTIDREKKCWIVDINGNIINTISCEGFSRCYFGDSEFMFGDKIYTEENKKRMVYIDKADIENVSEWTAIYKWEGIGNE